MASLLFGLSLDPSAVPQRHCFYESDEEEEEEETDQQPLFKFSGRGDAVKTSCLILCTSATASAFIRSHLCVEEEPFATISCVSRSKTLEGHQFDSGQLDRSDQVTSFYWTKGKNAVVCSHEQGLNTDVCNAWSDLVFGHVVPDTVVVLHSLSLHQLLVPELRDEESLAVLHSLQTRSWTQVPLAPFLNPPNTIGREPAAVLTSCQVRGVSAAMATLYSSNMLTFAEQVLAFKPLLTHQVFSKLPLVNSQSLSNSLLKKLTPKPSTNLDTIYT